MQISPGQFAALITVPAGDAPSDIVVADLNGDGLPDIIVTDQASGELTVLLNNPHHSFTQSLVFPASTSLNGLNATPGSPSVSSFAESVSLVVGDFTGNGSDVAVLNQGTHSFTVLVADGNGGFASPQLALTTSTSDGLNINNRPVAIVAGDFSRDGNTDLAVLMEDTGQLWIYAGNGNGTFEHTYSIPVGDDATGLSVVPGSGPGLLNLLVGNGFGDVLTLEGKGDGTFQIQGSRVSLSVVPNLLGPGEAGVLVGDQQNNRVTVQAPSANGDAYSPVQTLGSSTSTEQLAPGDVEWAFLDKGATLPDAIVVSTGSNAVVVYRTISVINGVPSFAANPRTYFVGTAPASVTVADINGDGIPDMLVADQGSNDVSVIFGSYNANGDWVGIPGPRLKSGGDGPTAVIVTDQTGDLFPDLAVFNGGSGTVTLLAGVGGGFFDDQQPTVLFNLGSALVQPPTFAGESGLGYVVTAGGDLVRFNLNDPSGGASVVFSDQQVLAAQALPSGQVVAALASGIVDLLAPQGNGLGVASELQATAGTPALPSAIDVVEKPDGLFNVLVSSQGSDTIFVFDTAAASTSSTGGASLPTLNTFQTPTASPTQVVIIAATANASGASQASVSATSSASATSGALSVSTGTTAGLSLGNISSVGNRVGNGTPDAVLVSVEGNTYLSVPVLGIGSENAEEAGAGEGRMPWLSTMLPFGDTSPLTRFVIGLDEALRDYPGWMDALPLRGAGPSHDPWNEDLFFRHLRVQPPVLRQEREGATEGGSPEAMLPNSNQNRPDHDRGPHGRFGDERWDEPLVQSSSLAARFVAGFVSLAGLLATKLLTPVRSGSISRENDEPDHRVHPKSTRDAESRPIYPLVSPIDERPLFANNARQERALGRSDRLAVPLNLAG